MSRAASLAFAVAAYAVFFATFLYLIIFVGDLTTGFIEAKTVDNPPSTLPLGAALLINLLLIALFGVQHSVMDWREDDFAAGFVFDNPNAKGDCGCGESFTV